MYELPKDRAKAQPSVFNAKCPARCLLTFLAGKWHLLVIDALAEKRWRNGELMRKIEGVSQKMLTQTLRELENMNLVLRVDMGTVPPHVEYELTPLGHELREKICNMDRWIEDNMFELIRDNHAVPLNYV